MVLQSEYFDPDTGIIHIFQEEQSPQVPLNATFSAELGLEDTAFNDVKCKLLSVDYKVKFYADQSGESNFDPLQPGPLGRFGSITYDIFGSAIFGIGNKNEDFNTFTSLGSFQGTSAWPVHVQGFYGQVGQIASVSKLWKPRKMGLSNEQNAFISVRNDSTSNLMYFHSSIYMRLIRL